jgi:hypothetical protein
MDRLAAAIDAVNDGTSLYWAFWESADPAGDQQVEIRLDLSDGATAKFEPPPGWRIHEVRSDGSVFLRRRQPMSREAVAGMLVEALRLAAANGARFHSWAHGENLA